MSNSSVKTLIAETIEQTDVAHEWDTSPQMYERYAESLSKKFLIIDRKELPEIEPHHQENVIACNNETFYCDPARVEATAETYRWRALMHLSVSEHFLNLSPEKAKRGRRDELAQKFSSKDYSECPESLRASIDYIITMESENNSTASV